jgi:hypothetical protein
MEEITKPIFPKDVERKYFMMIKDEFLKQNNLKLGDTILWGFHYSELRRNQSFTASEDSEGILKEDENGYLYVESKKEYTYYHHKWNRRTGRQSRYTWQRETRKAKHYFGQGFTFKPQS